MFFILFVPLVVNAQERFENDTSMAFKYLQERGEVYFSFKVSPSDIGRFSRILSVDNYSDGEAYAYASLVEFETFLEESVEFTVYPPPGEWYRDAPLIKNETETDDIPVNGEWDYYPTYTQYEDMMKGWAADYPHICEYIDAGNSVEGRGILFVKIAGGHHSLEPRPRFMYSSTMHGDETVGFVLMLRLIEYLLKNYPDDHQVRRLLDNLEIWINPLANPDAAYFGGDTNTIDSPKRYNANNIDLNRNFPVQDDKEITTDNRQPETIVMMEIMNENQFVLSANIHGGQEVINYPWDFWERRHPDDGWFEYICREYADTAMHYSPQGYMTFLGGVTNGYQWYPISGGRQDFVTYFASGREVTMEISNKKHPPPETLSGYWEYNRRSLLNFMEQAMFGIRGKVTDANTGEPVLAKVELLSHDTDNSFINTDSLNGTYFRLIEQGTYDLKFSGRGYYSKTVKGYTVQNRDLLRLDAELVPLDTSSTNPVINNEPVLNVFPVPAGEIINLEIFLAAAGFARISLYDSAGRKVKLLFEGRIEQGDALMTFNIEDVKPGLYMVVMKIGGDFTSRQIIISDL